MPIAYCHIASGNFGDDLNLTLWQQVFPNIDQLAPDIEMVGIGTLLKRKPSAKLRKVVLGAGAAAANIRLNTRDCDIRWVRGPKSARAVGVSAKLGIGDAAWLWDELFQNFTTCSTAPVGLIPHWATWQHFDWHKVASDAGMIAIDPGQSPLQVAEQMRRCSRIVTESLHGAVFADAMGIPWAPAMLAHRFHKFKWEDWTDTINRPLQPFMPDRALIRDIAPFKALKNLLAKKIHYQHAVKCPEMRATRPAAPGDQERVSDQLFQYCADQSNFSYSNRNRVLATREHMHTLCDAFARDYGLHFRHAAASVARPRHSIELQPVLTAA